MAANPYERIDEEFRLVDVNGVLPGFSPGDHIVIREPNGFDKANIITERNENHGVNVCFFDDKSLITFIKAKVDGVSLSSFEFVEQVYAIDGSDSCVLLQYVHTTTPEIVYEAELVFSERNRNDKGVTIRAERVDFEGKFTGRIETEYDINRTEDLDGNAITPISYNDILLTPQAVTKRAFVGRDIVDTPVAITGNASRVLINWGKVLESNLTDPLTIPITQFVSIATSLFDAGGVIWEPSRFGYYQFTYSIDFDVTADSSAVTTNHGFIILVFDREQRLVYLEELDSFTLGQNETKNVSIVDSVSGEFPVNKGYDVFFYFGTLGGGSRNVVSFTINSASFTLSGAEKSKFIETKYVNLIDGIAKATEGITGVSNPLIAPFLSNQKTALMTGKLIRGFPETNPFKIKWSDIAVSMKSIFGQGWGLIRRGDNSRVYMDSYSEFYRDEQIVDLGNAQADFEIDTDKEYIANEIEIGYSEFSEGSNTVLLNDSDKDFLTKYQFLTPIIKDKKKLEFVSQIIASGFVIEEGRQQSFGVFPDESWDKDDDLFLIALNEENDTVYDQFVVFRVLSGTNTIEIQNFIPSLIGATSVNIDGVDYTPSSAIVADEDRNITIIETADAIPPAPGGGLLATVRSDIVATGVTWTAPESDEAFDVLNGVEDDKATYNARYNLKYMLFNQSLLINSALEFKALTSLYRITSFKNNASLETQFKVGEGFSTLDPDRLQILMSDDLEKQDVNQGLQLFIPEIISYRQRLAFSIQMTIQDAYRDKLPYTLTLASAAGMNIGNELHQTTGILAQGTITDIQGNDVTVEMIDGKFIDGETVEDQTTLASSTISSQSSKNYGFVTNTAYTGIQYDAYLDINDWNPMTEMFKFIGKVKK